ncbi:MAG: SIS domain-containing protein [Bacillota bacterium]
MNKKSPTANQNAVTTDIQTNHANILDNIEKKTAVEMLRHADCFTSQIRNAWRLGEDVPLADFPPRRKIRRVIVCGMGGSGVGGGLAAKYAQNHTHIPVCAVKGYLLPQGIDEKTLVIAVSHSGETAETLHCYEQAKSLNAVCAVVSSGGTLLSSARENGDTCIEIPHELRPREAAAYLTIPVFLLLSRFGIWNLTNGQLLEILEAVNDVIFCCNRFVITKENRIKQLAVKAADKIPVILGVDGYMEAVAYRWKIMLNENAKLPAHANSLPEFCHNEIESVTPEHHLIILRSMAENSALKKQIAALENFAENQNIACDTLWLMGKNTIAKALAMMLTGDYFSLYLSCLRNTDCGSIQAVEHLKNLV